MADKTPDHRHCSVCGKPMGPNDRFDSPECETVMLGQRKRQQRTMWIFMGVLGLFMLLLYVTGGSGSCLGTPQA